MGKMAVTSKVCSAAAMGGRMITDAQQVGFFVGLAVGIAVLVANGIYIYTRPETEQQRKRREKAWKHYKKTHVSYLQLHLYQNLTNPL